MHAMVRVWKLKQFSPDSSKPANSPAAGLEVRMLWSGPSQPLTTHRDPSRITQETPTHGLTKLTHLPWGWRMPWLGFPGRDACAGLCGCGPGLAPQTALPRCSSAALFYHRILIQLVEFFKQCELAKCFAYFILMSNIYQTESTINQRGERW